MGDGRINQTVRNLEAETRGDTIDQRDVDNIIRSSGVLRDDGLTNQLAQRLEDNGVLPKLALNFEATVGNQLENENEQMDKGTIDRFVNENRLSPGNMFVAKALLSRWDDIDRDGIPGISRKELQTWAKEHGVEVAPKVGGVLDNVRVHRGGGSAELPGGVDVRTSRNGSTRINIPGMGEFGVDGNGRPIIKPRRR